MRSGGKGVAAAVAVVCGLSACSSVVPGPSPTATVTVIVDASATPSITTPPTGSATSTPTASATSTPTKTSTVPVGPALYPPLIVPIAWRPPTPVPPGATSGYTTAPPRPSTGTPKAGAAEMPGLKSETVPSGGGDVTLTYPVIKGATRLTNAARDWGIGARDTFLAEGGSKLLGAWTLQLQQWPMVGVRMEAGSYRSGAATSAVATLYTDASTGEVFTSSDLIADASKGAARAAIQAGLDAQGATVAPGALGTGRTASLLADLRFAADGQLEALVATGGSPRRGMGLAQVRLPADTAKGWLSDAGVRIRDAYVAKWTQLRAVGHQDAATDCARTKCVALSFDDGPGAYSDLILDQLQAVGAPASFFVLGETTQQRPAVIAREGREGVVVGNHSYDHTRLTKLSQAAQAANLAQGADAIEAAGAPRPTLMRPPYGSMNLATTKQGYPLIMWHDDSLDWESQDPTKIVAQTLEGVGPTSVILMHEIYPTTVDALPKVLKKLWADGYSIVGVEQLLGPSPKQGLVYGELTE